MPATSNDAVISMALRYKAGAGYQAHDSYMVSMLMQPPRFDLTDLLNPKCLLEIPYWEKDKRMGKSNHEDVVRQFEFQARDFLHEEAITAPHSMKILTSYDTVEKYLFWRLGHYTEDHGSHYFKCVILREILQHDLGEKLIAAYAPGKEN